MTTAVTPAASHPSRQPWSRLTSNVRQKQKYRMQNYVFDALSKGAFPSRITSDPNLYFHGTSCVFSDQIERNGFEFGYRPWRPDDLSAIAEKIKVFDEPLSKDLNLWAAHPVRFSLTKSFPRAFQHSIKARGGQTLGFIRKIRDRTDCIPDYLTALLDNADAADACIYAVSIKGISSDFYSIEYGVCYVTTSIPLDAIVAKIIIPKGTSPELMK
jgi:hypothetical protein